jgi:hypothetical protein
MSASPIQVLIEDRCLELGLTRHDIVRRAGYTNLSKGHRKLDELLLGDLWHSRGLISRLPAALGVSADVVNEAVAETERQMRAAEDVAYRAAFRPHAIILTEYTRPTSITMAAIGGADRKLRVDFEPGSSPMSYLKQALDQVRRRSPITFYGAAVGVVINFSPDHAVRFDLDGNVVDVLPAAHRPGQLTISIGGRSVPPELLVTFFGSRTS